MQYQPLSDYLLISDIDGTLVNTKKEIPPRNIEAIAHFREMGGRFTIATGRSPTIWRRSRWCVSAFCRPGRRS